MATIPDFVSIDTCFLEQLIGECKDCPKTLQKGYFCSRSCKNAAFRLNLINDADIDYDKSNLKLKTPIMRNTNTISNTQKIYTIQQLAEECPYCPETLRGGGCFCSRGCRNAAFRLNLICDADVDYEVSNPKLVDSILM